VSDLATAWRRFVSCAADSRAAAEELQADVRKLQAWCGGTQRV